MTLRIICRVAALSAGIFLFCVTAEGQTAPDAFLYYQRTHGGQLPPPGVDPTDHSGETADVIPATDKNVAKPVITPQLDSGINATNLGKGDWIWEMPQTETHLGLSSGDVQGVIDYEVSLGMKWITVKCGDGGSIWTQFSSDLVTRAHNAGLKIFGWAYAYGNNVAHYGSGSSQSANINGEINVALNALNLGADGFIIDAEIEYETNTTRLADAVTYASTIKSNYPNRFMAHAPFPYLNVHSGFPYVQFGVYCDAIMPQDYWGAIGTTPENVVVQMNTRWITWQNAVALTNPAAIKPIAPLGQSYAPVTGAEITRFMIALSTNTPMATVGGYKGVSFWDAQERTSDMDNAVRSATTGVPGITSVMLSRVAETGSNVTFTVTASGQTPFGYQWQFNGANISGATSTSYTLTNAQTTNSGSYTAVVTNTFGATTSVVASLTVYPPQAVVFSDDFDSNTSANWVTNESSADNSVVFNYNYANDGIASAPHSSGGTTKGVRFQANLTAAVVAAINISPVGQSFAGDYRLHFDMWINTDGPFPGGGSGSTEFLTAGIGTTGHNVQWTGSPTTADGYWFSVDAEGGVSGTSTTSGDYLGYIGTAGQQPSAGIYYAGTDTTAHDNANPYYLAGYPGGQSAPALQQSTYGNQTGALALGTVGFTWHDVIVSRKGSVVDWAIDGIKVSTISNATFTANNVFIGFWDPFASLSANNAESFGLVDNVRVEQPIAGPTITAQTTNLTVVQGANATFNVTATGLPAPAYQWRFNGTNIGGATASSYTRLSAQAADAGPYTVVVTNVGGAVTSSVATLTVNVPPSITGVPQDQTVNQGGSATFTVSATSSPAPTYQWRFNGTNISGATDSSYTKLNAQPADAGPYSVMVSNVAGFTNSPSANLTVNVPPSITAQPTNVSVRVGNNATFTVSATGTPPPGYQWQFNGSDISGATASSYTRLNAQTNDAGNYSVIVSNVAGPITSSNAVLTVTVPQPLQFQLISILPDQTVRLVLSGEVGSNYTILSSSNLSDWAPLGTVSNTNGTFEFIDDPATNGQRMYRATLAP